MRADQIDWREAAIDWPICDYDYVIGILQDLKRNAEVAILNKNKRLQ